MIMSKTRECFDSIQMEKSSKWLETDFEFREFELIKIKKDSRKQKDKTSWQLPFPLSIFQFSAPQGFGPRAKNVKRNSRSLRVNGYI